MQYKQITNAINTQSQDALTTKVDPIRWINELKQQYGDTVVFIDTWKSIAYVLYFFKKHQPMIACRFNLQIYDRHFIIPCWNVSFEIGQASIGLLNGTFGSSFLKATKSQPPLQQVNYLADINKQNFAIAKSHQDAPEVLEEIQGNWGNK